MRAYLALIKIDIKLAARDRSVIFFNYLFPLLFFFVFAEMMGSARGGWSVTLPASREQAPRSAPVGPAP